MVRISIEMTADLVEKSTEQRLFRWKFRDTNGGEGLFCAMAGASLGGENVDLLVPVNDSRRGWERQVGLLNDSCVAPVIT